MRINFIPSLWHKPTQQRITKYAALVFVFQVLAVGFCAPSSLAEGFENKATMQVSEHCASSSNMQTMLQHDGAEESAHSCAHCDLPDLVASADKLSFAAHAMAILDTLPAQELAVQGISITYDVNFSPHLRTALLTYNLNQRFRI